MLHHFFSNLFLDSDVNYVELKKRTRKNILLFSGRLYMKLVFLQLFCKAMYLALRIRKIEKFSLAKIFRFYRSGLGRIVVKQRNY